MNIWTQASTGILFFIAALALLCPPEVGAQEPNDPYLGQLNNDEGGSWFQRELYKYRVFPLLDKAERMRAAGKPAEARQEMARALAVSQNHPLVRLRLMIMAYELGDLEAAVAQAGELLRAHPGFVPAHLYRGFSYQKLGRIEEALADFERASRSTPITPADRQLALRSLAEVAIQRKKFETASAALKALALVADKSHALSLSLGRALVEIPDFAGARSAYKDALARATSSGERLAALDGLVEVSRRAEDWSAAQKWQEQAAAEDPNNPARLRELAATAVRNADREAACRIATRLYALSGELADLETLARLRVEAKQYPEAIRALEEWLESHGSAPERPRVLTLLGYTHQRMGKPDAALADFQRAFGLAGDLDSLLSLASLEDQLGMTDQAISALEIYLDKRRSPRAQYHLGVYLAKLGDRERALSEIQAAVDAGLPEAIQIEAYRSLGEIYREAGRVRESVALVDRALARYPRSARLHLIQAENRLGLRQWDRAIGELERCLSLGLRNAETWTRLAVAHEMKGDTARALAILTQLLGRRSSPEGRAQLWTRVGHLHHQNREFDQAAESFLMAREITGKQDSGLLLLAAQSLAAGQNLRRAQGLLETALGQGTLGEQGQAEAYALLGSLQSRQGLPESAAVSFTQAIAHGKDSSALRQELGLLLFGEKRFEEACGQFERALALRAEPRTKVYLGRCYKARGQTAEALRLLQEGLAEQPGLDGQSQDELGRELAALYLERGELARAEQALTAALRAEAAPESVLLLARAKRLQGKPTEAQGLLERLDPAHLPRSLKAERLDELAASYLSSADPQTAASLAGLALKLEKSPERLYRYAQSLRQSQRSAEALSPLREALEHEPDNALFLQELAFSLRDAGSPEESREALEKALAKAADKSAVHANLGYLYKEMGETDKAVTEFRKAIDELPGSAPQGGELALSQRAYPYRSEVSNLTQVIDAVAYFTYTTRRSARLTGLGQLEQGAADGAGGLELSIQPPWIGYVRERRFQVYGRFLWNTEPGALTLDARSYQAAVGLRYQPFASQNLFVAAERLIKVGDAAMNNWLLRLQHAIGTGQGLIFGDRLYNHTALYSELDGFLDGPRLAALNLQLRQGLTWNPDDRILLTPHLVGVGRFEWPDRQQGSAAELGAGLSIAWLFADTRYETHRASVELNAEWKLGWLLAPQLGQTSRDYNGLFISALVRI